MQEICCRKVARRKKKRTFKLPSVLTLVVSEWRRIDWARRNFKLQCYSKKGSKGSAKAVGNPWSNVTNQGVTFSLEWGALVSCSPIVFSDPLGSVHVKHGPQHRCSGRYLCDCQSVMLPSLRGLSGTISWLSQLSILLLLVDFISLLPPVWTYESCLSIQNIVFPIAGAAG